MLATGTFIVGCRSHPCRVFTNRLLVCIFYSDKERPIAEEISRKMTERAIAMEGTVTGEHGVGMSKRDKVERELGPDTINLMRQVSQ